MRQCLVCLQKDLFSTPTLEHTGSSACSELSAIFACTLPLASLSQSSQSVQYLILRVLNHTKHTLTTYLTKHMIRQRFLNQYLQIIGYLLFIYYLFQSPHIEAE